jgi:hypothetical protein
MFDPAPYDSKTLTAIYAALDRAYNRLSADQRARCTKDQIMTELLRSAKSGERDPDRLVVIATAAGLGPLGISTPSH